MSQSIIIRPVIITDVPTIHAIYSHNVLHGTASWELVPPDQEEIGKRMGSILEQRFPYFVAELAGRVVGYSYASSYRVRPGYRFTVENSVYVADDVQRRGVGQLLLNHLITACSERGYRQMIAVIGDSQNTASIRLHRSVGFEQVGLLPNIGFKFGRWLDSVLMQRDLGEGAKTLPK